MHSARIVIVGSGVVGTATGEGFRAFGHRVSFVDISTKRVQQLRARGLDAGTEIDLSDAPEGAFVFLTLPTPNDGRSYDLGAFTAGTATVGRALARSSAQAPHRHTVVVRSTVPPGTTEALVRSVLEQHSGRTAGVDFGLAANPEFLRAATAEEDFRNPWMTVVGSRDPRAVDALRDLLTPYGGELRTFTDPAQAELVKCTNNLYNATKISFWNEMWLVAQRAGLELDAVASTVAAAAEGSWNPEYGIRGGAPYGGVCLPKDTCGFLGYADGLGVAMPLLSAVVETNARLAAVVDGEADIVAAVPLARASA